jgi:ribosome-binding factor A
MLRGSRFALGSLVLALAMWIATRGVLHVARRTPRRTPFAPLSSRPDGSRLNLFARGQPNETRRQQGVAATVREALDVTLASGVVKDTGFADGAAVHVRDVQISKNVLIARVLWEPQHERYDPAAVQRALTRKRGILRQHVNSYLNQACARARSRRCPATVTVALCVAAARHPARVRCGRTGDGSIRQSGRHLRGGARRSAGVGATKRRRGVRRVKRRRGVRRVAVTWANVTRCVVL